MPTYKVVKHHKRIIHQEYLVKADNEKNAISIVEGGGGIHLPEWDTEEPADVSCDIVEEVED